MNRFESWREKFWLGDAILEVFLQRIFVTQANSCNMFDVWLAKKWTECFPEKSKFEDFFSANGVSKKYFEAVFSQHFPIFDIFLQHFSFSLSHTHTHTHPPTQPHKPSQSLLLIFPVIIAVPITLGGRHSTEEALALLTQPSRVRFPHLTAGKIKNRTQISCSENLPF